MKPHILVSTDFQNGAFIGEFEQFFGSERNELTLRGIVFGDLVVGDDLMFLDFPDEFWIFCLFESHVKDSSGLDFFSLNSNFLRKKVPADFFLRFGRRYFLTLNTSRLTANRRGYCRACLIIVPDKFERMLNSFIIFVNGFLMGLGVLGTWQTQNGWRIWNCLTHVERKEPLCAEVVSKLVKDNE